MVLFQPTSSVLMEYWIPFICCKENYFVFAELQRKFFLQTSHPPKSAAGKSAANFTLVPKCHCGKYSISAIFALKSHYTGFLLGVFGNPICYFVYDQLTQILCIVPYDAQPSWLHQVVCNIQTTSQSSQ